MTKQTTAEKRLMLFAAAALAMCALGAPEEINPVFPFLAVTGRPTDAELGRKVAALKADGFDQFLVYARSGLQYKYMGEEWLHAVGTLCREAEARGMKVWLYDEYNWPSGTCRGRVPAADERFRYSAKWDVKFWNPQHDADSSPGLFSADFTAR